ncbi:hypothetical protein E2C01_077320 [Portunus trituberculatus]|uniref:Uncharacterized protein n=1 Tax=Portunus trituberculatus TaxID=210409 RepID=A0A5B7IJZ9_PORTR|nr:hypothetical protein [Portunus trituberculatus]
MVVHPSSPPGGRRPYRRAARERGSSSRSYTMRTERSSQRDGEAAALSRGVTSRHLVSRLAALLNTPLRPPYMGASASASAP